MNKFNTDVRHSIFSFANTWHASISSLIRRLGKVSGQTEGKFLSIGGKLQEYYMVSKNITNQAESAAQLLAGESIEQTVNSLRELTGEINGVVGTLDGETRKILDAFLDITSILRNVKIVLTDFDKKIMTLQTLKIFTAIAVARLTLDKGNFKSLTNDISKLTESVADKIVRIRNGNSILLNEAEKLRRDIEMLYSGKQAESKSNLSRIESSLEMLEEQYSINGQVLGQVVDKSEFIASNINEVVTSLQFHDISRQRIEHVTQSVKETSDKIHSWEDESSDKEIIETLYELKLAFGIDIAQINDTREQILSAGDKIVENIINIQYPVNEISEILSNLTLSSQDNFLNKIEMDIDLIISVLKEIKEYGVQLAEAIRKMMSNVNNIAGWMKDIDNIGFEIKLLALNAQIKAAHLGKEGAELGVLAESIQGLSGDVVESIGQITKNLNHVFNESKETLDHFEKVGLKRIEHSDFEVMLSAIKMPLDKTKKDFQELQYLVGEISSQRKSMSHDIKVQVAGIRIHEDVSKELSRIAESLTEIQGNAMRILDGVDTSGIEKELEQLKRSYTMESERIIHEQAGSNNSDNTNQVEDDGIDLFDDNEPDSEDVILFDEEQEDASNEFGDNIELF